MDPARYKVLHYLISKEGKWSPRPIVPEPDGNPEIDVVFPVLHGTFGEDGTSGSAGTGGLALRRRGRAGFVRFHGQGDDEARCRERGLPVVDYFVVPGAERRSGQCEPGFPSFVKPANLGRRWEFRRRAMRRN